MAELPHVRQMCWCAKDRLATVPIGKILQGYPLENHRVLSTRPNRWVYYLYSKVNLEKNQLSHFAAESFAFYIKLAIQLQAERAEQAEQGHLAVSHFNLNGSKVTDAQS